MAKDEDHKKDMTEHFDKAVKKGVKLTKAQHDGWFTSSDSMNTKESWKRIRENMREIRKQRRRNRRK